MMNLKDYFKESKKEVIYNFYQKICLKPKDYEKITKDQMYKYIIDSYIEDPEIILRLINIEEINILKGLIIENMPKKNEGYIEYLLIKDLLDNYLILESETEYYIPEDLINPIKMAINILNEKEYSLKDITGSVILGLIRIHNVILIDDFINYLKEYNIIFDYKSFKEYLKNDIRNKNKINLIKYKGKEYIISLENNYYKDILKIRVTNDYKHGTLEEVISIGKYKINLFKEEIFAFLNFLEQHLTPPYIDVIINDLIIYMGFDINNEEVLRKIADNIEELYKELLIAKNYFPIWVSNGKTIADNL